MKPINLKPIERYPELVRKLNENKKDIYNPDTPQWLVDEKKKSVAYIDTKMTELHENKTWKDLGKAISAAQGRSYERTIDVEDILNTLDKYTQSLNISKKAMEGITATFDRHAQAFPNAYKWTPQSTQFTATFHAGSWRITDIFRDTCTKHDRHLVTLPPEAKTAILQRFM